MCTFGVHIRICETSFEICHFSPQVWYNKNGDYTKLQTYNKVHIANVNN